MYITEKITLETASSYAPQRYLYEQIQAEITRRKMARRLTQNKYIRTLLNTITTTNRNHRRLTHADRAHIRRTHHNSNNLAVQKILKELESKNPIRAQTGQCKKSSRTATPPRYPPPQTKGHTNSSVLRYAYRPHSSAPHAHAHAYGDPKKNRRRHAPQRSGHRPPVAAQV